MPLPVLTSARGSLDDSILVVSSRELSLLDTGSSTKGSPHATLASGRDRGEEHLLMVCLNLIVEQCIISFRS
ncbi:hypothetical protein PNOK_0468600 [Pyrrhoderma noxium]|uniref:Uncharacterized protein n=1 Tax=Pyrrhoderma noxium TaxID=2282107 RepID=A0A286UJJ2_9AGAM|nr:hypothetical protein PNOK_0468600 [Pyrrhoderma noxium]